MGSFLLASLGWMLVKGKTVCETVESPSKRQQSGESASIRVACCGKKRVHGIIFKKKRPVRRRRGKE
jgi:hypothetical protein